MNDIRKHPAVALDGLTIRQMKEILSVLPDKNEYGEDYEIWIDSGRGLSNPVIDVWALNKREDGCDILLKFFME